MRKPITLFLTAATFITALAPLAATPAEARRGKKTAIVAGVILGAAAAAALAGSSRRARASEVYVEDSDTRFQRYCARLDRRCRNGNENACYQFDDDCGGY